MKIAIAGSRGTPARYGGFETFAEEISQSLSQREFDVTVVCEKGTYIAKHFGKVNLVYSKFSKQKNPVRFYYNSLRVGLNQSNLVIVCGVGGAFFYPLLRKKNKIIIKKISFSFLTDHLL